MFRQISNHKRTAAISTDGRTVTVMSDDGWQEILDYRFTVASEAEARAKLARAGFEEYDPNAHLKAQGYVFRDGCYRPHTEPTEQGNQYVIPGCEKDKSRGPKQMDLF